MGVQAIPRGLYSYYNRGNKFAERIGNFLSNHYIRAFLIELDVQVIPWGLDIFNIWVFLTLTRFGNFVRRTQPEHVSISNFW